MLQGYDRLRYWSNLYPSTTELPTNSILPVLPGASIGKQPASAAATTASATASPALIAGANTLGGRMLREGYEAVDATP